MNKVFSKVLAAFGAAGGFAVGATMVELLSGDVLQVVASAPAGRVLVIAVPSLLTAAVAWLKTEHRGYGGNDPQD